MSEEAAVDAFDRERSGGMGGGRVIRTLVGFALVLTLATLAMPIPGQSQEPGLVVVPKGNSFVISHPRTLERVLISDPDIADVIPVSAQEIVVNGITPGSTTLLFWDVAGIRTTYSVRVTVDAASVENELRRLFPNEALAATAVGNTLILSGETRNPQVAERALALAASLDEDARILDHIVVPDRGQILLQVRVAEVGRSAMRDLGAHLMRVDPLNLRGDDEGLLAPGGVVPPAANFLNNPPGPDQTFSDAVNFFLFHNSSNVSAFIQALQSQGNFRSLAEPNLMTLPNETASFLAGGEFPYPVVQGGAQAGGVTVEFREFGVRLNFTPQITNSGAIRLAVEPEVSTLDFSSGLELGGFQIPVLLSRRANTVVEVQEGQTFAIAGLMDHQMTESIRKIPLLGDIPILGALFRSSSYQQSQTELLVLVTPHLVGPGMAIPDIPTGEVDTWNWFGPMQPDATEVPAGSQQDQ